MPDHSIVFTARQPSARAAMAMLGWILLLALFVGSRCYARSDRLQARLFDEADGLADLSITAFAQQSDGHLWIATANGLFRYDGSAFTEFGRADGLLDKTVFSLHIDHIGTLWAGTHGGLFRFDGRTFHEIRLAGKSLRIGVNSMLASTTQGELIAESPSEIVSVERYRAGGEWSAVAYRVRHPTFSHGEDTDGIAVDSSDRLWFGCSAKLCSYNGRSVDVFGPDQGVAKDFYVSIFVARNGRLWARGRKHILTWRAGDTGMQDVSATFPAGGMVTVNRRFTEDAWGRILTPTAKGFATWDGQPGGTDIHESRALVRGWTETLATSAGKIEGASEIFADQEGSLWIGTEGSGLLHSLGYGLWRNYGSEEGLGGPNAVVIEADRAGKIWIGHNLGSNILDPATGQILPSPLASENDAAAVQGLAADPEGGMWVASLLGNVFHVNAGGSVDGHLVMDAYIRCIRLDGHGVLWIASSNGLYMIESTRKPYRMVRFHVAGSDDTSIGDMALAPDGSLWIASRQGLDRIRANETTHFTVSDQPDGLKLLCFGGDGSLWVTGAVPGVFHIQIQGKVGVTLGSVNRPRLASDRVVFLQRDSKGSIWIGTDHGVNVLSGQALFRITDEDGLIWNDCGEGFLAQTDGSVWIGTSKGLSYLPNPVAVLKRNPFATVIEDARYNGKTIPSDSELKWTGAAPALRFSGLTFRDNRRLFYHYQLIGFDSTENVGEIPSASYPRLPPGSYTFRVYAVDAGKGVVSSPAELHFSLMPPWWRTTWFESLAVAGVFGLVAALWYVLHLALLGQRRKLQRMVQERTAELEHIAMHDALTGLLNRRALLDALEFEMESAYRNHTDLCVAIIDLDHFKRVNDTHGHQAGDEVLRQTARRLTAAARSSESRGADIVGRYGGEEFLVIFRNVKSAMGIERCESIRKAMCAEPISYLGTELTVTCSIGLAKSWTSAEPVAKLLAEADRALYSAKKKGRNQVECAPETSSGSLKV